MTPIDKKAAELLKKYGKTVGRVGGMCTIQKTGTDALIRALAARGMSHAMMSKALRGERIDVPSYTIQRHIAGTCRCGR